eukprot:20110_2
MHNSPVLSRLGRTRYSPADQSTLLRPIQHHQLQSQWSLQSHPQPQHISSRLRILWGCTIAQSSPHRQTADLACRLPQHRMSIVDSLRGRLCSPVQRSQGRSVALQTQGWMMSVS